MYLPLFLTVCLLGMTPPVAPQRDNSLGRFQEAFAWKQLTYDFNGIQVTSDRFGDLFDESEAVVRRRRLAFNSTDGGDINVSQRRRTRQTTARTTRQTTASSSSNNFFIQYNNLPMGVERVGDRLFVTVPRRRYGIPSTLNYIDLTDAAPARSPPLRPYPDTRQSRQLTSVYRTRADGCGRLWMVDTGLLEIPGDPQQVQRPSIVIFDLNSNTVLRRYPLRDEDIPAANTPTGLASITVEIPQDDCSNAYAYIPELTTYGIIVYSFRENRSWRVTHNYFHFDPTASTLRIGGQRFQWNDGIFSIALSAPLRNGCRTAWFHPMVSTHEFTVNTCILRNSSASEDSNYWGHYFDLGNRGEGSQSTMHDFHPSSHVLFFADIGRDAISCWNTDNPLTSQNIAILAQNNLKLSYPSDLHVTGDEVWFMANNLPRWAYSRLDTDEYNFFIYRANVRDLIANTVCQANPRNAQSTEN